MGHYKRSSAWSRIPIAKIEDLSDAVYGAGLEATQMGKGVVTGSLAFAEENGVIISSGLIGGHVALRGPLSMDMITIGIGLRVTSGTWHWLNEVHTGNIGVFHPGDEHDSLYMPGSLYSTVTLSAQRLEQEAAKEDLVLDAKTLGGTGFHPYDVPAGVIRQLRTQFERIHCDGPALVHGETGICETMLRAVVDHFTRPPFLQNRGTSHIGHARIFARARAYIMEHLSEPLSLDELASAACASRRTLQRAFVEILGDSPHVYVRRLRLHRIRHDLASDEEKACTIALISNQWGISELGRMSGWYRELFGERPSDTVAHASDSHRAALDTR